MKGRALEWRSHLLLATFSILLTLAFAEVAARVLLRPAPVGEALGTPISELSPTLGWRTRPTGSQRIQRPDFDVTVSINGRGLRGPLTPYEAGPGKRRLAIMGDSFAHGYYANEPETLAGRLAVAVRPCGVDVLNAGAPGYSTDQEWLYYGEEIHKYRPSELVLLFYYNDLLFNTEGVGTANRPKPVFTEKDGSLQLVPPLTKPLPPERLEPDAPRPWGAPTFHHSALWAFAAARLQRSRPDWSKRLSEYGFVPELSTEPPAEYVPFGPKNANEKSRVEKMWERTSQILRLFRDDVRRTGAGFSVFYVPSRFEANDDAWSFVRRRYEADRPWKRDSVRARLSAVLVALDIPFHEAGAAFQSAERSAQPAYLALDGHWNARGNEIAFESLFPSLRRAFSCGS